MSETKVDPNPEPFFVRFLEDQQALAVQTDVKAGKPPFHTLKYPSDNEEGGGGLP